MLLSLFLYVEKLFNIVMAVLYVIKKTNVAPRSLLTASRSPNEDCMVPLDEDFGVERRQMWKDPIRNGETWDFSSDGLG